MKKLVLTTALILALGLTTFAQSGGGALRRSKEYREYLNAGKMNNQAGGLRTNNNTPLLPNSFGNPGNTPLLPNSFGNPGDFDGTDAPLGSGIAVLIGLGAAYAIGKKRKED